MEEHLKTCEDCRAALAAILGDGDYWLRPPYGSLDETTRAWADSPLILTTRELMRREMIRWFGPYADRIQVAASGNLPYNQTQLAREGLGIYLVIRLDCAYDGLRFVPLSPPLESGTVLAWKKTEVLSATAAALLRFAEKYVGGISDHPV